MTIKEISEKVKNVQNIANITLEDYEVGRIWRNSDRWSVEVDLKLSNGDTYPVIWTDCLNDFYDFVDGRFRMGPVFGEDYYNTFGGHCTLFFDEDEIPYDDIDALKEYVKENVDEMVQYQIDYLDESGVWDMILGDITKEAEYDLCNELAEYASIEEIAGGGDGYTGAEEQVQGCSSDGYWFQFCRSYFNKGIIEEASTFSIADPEEYSKW